MIKITNTELGCVDWIHTEKGRLLMELNGISTGFGYTGGAYNLNKEIAEKLKIKYLN